MIDSEMEKELENGSPEKWKKRELPGTLILRFLIWLIMLIPFYFMLAFSFFSLNPIFVTWFFVALSLVAVIAFPLCCLYSFRKYGKSQVKPERSSYYTYGINHIKKAKASITFRVVCSVVCLILAVLCIVLGSLYSKGIAEAMFYEDGMNELYEKGYTISEITGAIISWLCFVMIVFYLLQMQGVWCFGNQLRKYTCPQCGYVNSARKTEISDCETSVRDVAVQHVRGSSGGTTKVGTATVDGTTVDVYGYSSGTPGYTVYETTEFHSWKQGWKCCKCGRTWNSHEGYSKKVEGTESYKIYD